MSKKTKEFQEYKKGDKVQSSDEFGNKNIRTIVEGPYQQSFTKGFKIQEAYTVLDEKTGRMTVADVRDLSPFIAPPTLLEAAKDLLLHHRIEEQATLSTTFTDRVHALRCAIAREEVSK